MTPTYRWFVSTGADHYYLYVVDTSTGQVVVNLPDASTGASVTPMNYTLTVGHNYTWYLGAESTNGLDNEYNPLGLQFTIM